MIMVDGFLLMAVAQLLSYVLKISIKFIFSNINYEISELDPDSVILDPRFGDYF